MKIYRNGVEIYEIKDFKVIGRFMEVATLDCTIKSPTPIAFGIGDYVTYDYNNLTYSLYDIPAPKKQARSGSYGEAFIYNLKFKSNMEHLVICPFLDLVANDNTLHYTSLPSFSTFENVYGIAARIQANMDYLYPGKWRIVVGETSDSELLETLNEAKEFAISGQSCFEGLKKIYDTWGVGYIYSEANGINTITIGKSAGTTSVFRYGKGQGLRTIGKNIQNNDQFCTRAYVFGSTRNLPARWYNEKGYIGEAQYAPNLMIPFSKWVGGIPQGAYIDAIFGGENRVEKYGLRIKTFSYDGSGNNEEIYPSIEKVTAGNIRSAKAELGETKYIPSSRYSNSERMDYILEGSSILDDGVSAEAGYELYSEKLTASVEEIKESIIIAEPLKEEKYKLLSFQKNIVICSFDITKSAIYQISEIAEMFSFSKNDLESTISAKWYMQTPDGSFIDLKKSLTFTDKLQASLQLPQVTFEAKETGKYTLVLRLSVGWSVEYVVPQIDGDIFLTYAVNSDSVEISRGTRILSSTFTLKLKQIGFDLNSVTASDGSKKTITMKDGMCGGRSFVIRQCKYSTSDDSWELVCSRVNDSSVSQTFPNSIFPISAGDQFVLLNINMPDLYVHTAMQRLYDTALADLKHYSIPQFVVSPEIDNLQMARSPQILREGMYMPIEDSDIDIDEDILIDSVTITEKGTELRSFSVTLRNDKIYNRFSKIATSISNLESSIEEAKKNAVNTPVADDSTTEVLVDSNNVATEEYFELTPEDEVKTKDDKPLIGKEARFSNLALPASAPTEPKEGEVYGYISDRSNSAVDLTPLFKRINVGTEDNPQWAVIPVDFNGNPVGIVSDTFITSGGRKGGSSGTGSSFNRLDSWDNYNPNAGDVLSAVLGYELKTRLDNLNVGLDESKLKEYLDTNEYITKTAGNELYAPLASFNELNTKFNDFLTGSDIDNTINKWKELEAFLAGQTETSTLADLLAVKADKTALEAVTTRVITVEGYFTNKAANNALKLGGQLPEYYATASALSTHISTYNTFVNNTYAAHIAEYNTHVTAFNNYKSATDKRLADLEALWAIDEDNNGLYPKSGRGIWSESYITAGGVGTSGGGSGTGGGLIQNVYSYADLGGTFNNNVLTDTFNAYTINQLYTSGEAIKGRVEVLEANMGVINPDTLLSLNDYIAGSSARITSIEDWINNPTADTAYFNELGVRDKLNVSGPATFDERITGVITEAINLTGTPEIKITGDTIAVLVGEKASAYITVPYANNALKLGGQLPEYYATASALSAVERITSEGLSRISNLLSSIEEQMCNASFETIIAREVGIEDKLNVAGNVTIDSDLDITGIATATVLVAGSAVLNTATVTTLNGYTPITSGNISSQYVMHAATAGKLTDDALAGLTVGHSTQPVYFNGGVPVACTRYADASVNYATTAALAVADKQGNDITTTYTKKTETRSTGYAIGKLSNLISELEDWVSNPTADTAYFNELGIRDKLNVSGLSTFNANVSVNANIVATGAITAGSDARYKNKLQDVAVDIKTIANAPLFNFRWNDGREDNRTYLGTTAQYWAETNFHNAVIPTTDEKLWTMSYSQIAMGNTIVLARELLPIKHKVSEIDHLKDSLHKAERRIEILENELSQYRRV